MLNELESQNDAHVEGILGKVKILKDVRLPFSPLSLPRLCLCRLHCLLLSTTTNPSRSLRHEQMTVAIGDEIRDSSAFAEKMNDSFDSTRLRLRGTMNRMMVMAERTGVGWKVWLGFFAAVTFVFMYVWLF